MLPLLNTDLVLFDQFEKVPLVVAAQGRLAEVRIRAEKVTGIDLIVAKVAAPAARCQDFAAGALGVVKDENLAPAPRRFHGAEKAGGPGADDDDIDFGHGPCRFTIFILYLLLSVGEISRGKRQVS